MTWAAKRQTNKPIIVFFPGPITVKFYLLFLTGHQRAANNFEIPLSLINVVALLLTAPVGDVTIWTSTWKVLKEILASSANRSLNDQPP